MQLLRPKHPVAVLKRVVARAAQDQLKKVQKLRPMHPVVVLKGVVATAAQDQLRKAHLRPMYPVEKLAKGCNSAVQVQLRKVRLRPIHPVAVLNGVVPELFISSGKTVLYTSVLKGFLLFPSISHDR